MAGRPSRAGFRRLIARLGRRGRAQAPDRADLDSVEPDLRLPEQRLVDAAARYGRMLAGDGRTQRRADAAAAGVRTVPPTDPSETGQPVWVRRLADPSGMGSKPADPTPVETDEPAAVSAAHGPQSGS
jgi:hypothetical protein